MKKLALLLLLALLSSPAWAGLKAVSNTGNGGGSPGGTNGQLQYNNSGAFGGVTLTTTGTTGAATMSGGTLNIPQYSSSTFQQAMASEIQLSLGGL